MQIIFFIAVTAITLVVWYFLIKAAVRNAILEAKMTVENVAEIKHAVRNAIIEANQELKNDPAKQ